jgi:hypothetical protein
MVNSLKGGITKIWGETLLLLLLCKDSTYGNMLHVVLVWLNDERNLSHVHVGLGWKSIEERCMPYTFLSICCML